MFSVCIVVRDRPIRLGRAVRSVLASDYTDFELVIVDDGSQTPVTNMLWRVGIADDERVRIIHQPPLGIAVARNTALAAATGEYVTVLDSDDELAPDALGHLDKLVSSTGCDWVYTNYEEVLRGTSRLITVPSYPNATQMRMAILTRPRMPFKHSGMTIKRSLLSTLGGYDETLSIKVDVELMLRALHHGVHPHHIAHPIVRFHRHTGNVSRRRVHGIKTWFTLIDRYGPAGGPVSKMGAKLLRASFELGKWVASIGG
jgi:glycosyltransferase involved in cell wall biosynthesis